MNSSVAFTIIGSAFGSGKPVTDEEFTRRMISEAGRRASEAMVYTCAAPAVLLALGVAGVGLAATLGPRDDNSGVWGESNEDADTLRCCGVCGTGTVDTAGVCSSVSSTSSTAFASAILARRTSTLKRHMARSRFGRDMRRSVRSAT